MSDPRLFADADLVRRLREIGARRSSSLSALDKLHLQEAAEVLERAARPARPPAAVAPEPPAG